MPNKEFFVQDGLKVKGNTLLNGANYSHSPLAKLHVKTAANGVNSNLNNVNGIIIENSGTSNSNYALKLATGAGNIFSVTNAGNVGIGVTTPNVELTVVGDISATGSLYGNIEDLSFDTITITGDLNVGGTVFTDALSAGTEIESPVFIGNLRGAVSFKAQAGEDLTKGDVVYISGISGNTTIVSKADADDPSKMPAFGIANETASLNTSVTIINFGAVTNLNTSAFPEGTELFVSTTAGLLTSAAPTGESSLLQKMAKVTRQDASAGSITVMGAGRTNAVPNLNEGRLFVGNSSNQAVADSTLFVDIADSKVGIGTTDPTYKLDVSGDGRFTSDILVNSLTVGKGGGNVSTNTALGVDTLYSNTTGCYNVAIGYQSLFCNVSGTNNIATGYRSLFSNTTGSNNIATGISSLRLNTTGNHNIATGLYSLYCNVSGSYNIATGGESLRFNTTGDYNVAIGYQSLRSNTTGNYNIAVGACSLRSNTVGNYNIATGYQSLFCNVSGSYNIATGVNSLLSNTTGSCNIATGFYSLYSNTTGYNNIATGVRALCSNTTGNNNTATGVNSLRYNTTGSNNIATGVESLYSNTTGNYNIATGLYSLYCNVSGSYNIATGGESLRFNTTGDYNVAIGYQSLRLNTTGSCNIATGVYSLRCNTTGIINIATGYQSLYSNTTGNSNIATGVYSLRCNTTGSYNIATGVNAGYNLNSDGNVVIGYLTGCTITTGTYNTLLGYNAQTLNATDTNSIVIGYNATGLGSNTISLGNSNITKTIINSGNVGIGTTTPNEKLHVNGSQQIENGSLYFKNSTQHGFIPFPDGAWYDGSSISTTGAIKISLPVISGTPADMMSFWVDIFDYTTNETVSLYIAGYNYQAIGGSTWVNPTAMVFSKLSTKNYTVRFGDDGTNKCIWIGETSSTWSYPQVVVRDFQGGHNTNISDYKTGWSIDIVASLGTVDETVSGNFPQASNADTLDGIQGSQFVRSDTDDNLDGRYTILDQTTTIGGSNWDNGWLKIGDSSLGWSIDNNEIYNSGDGFIGTLKTSGNINFRFPNGGTLTRESNLIWDAGNDGSGSGLDADLLDGNHASDFVSRIDLSNDVQLNSYRKSVIALCDINNDNISRHSFSSGTIIFKRNNGSIDQVEIDISIQKKYNVQGATVFAVVKSNSGYADNFQFVQFDYNGNSYAGIEFYFTNANHSYVYFRGETNFSIFGLDYYDTQTPAVLNSEVNNSISTSDITLLNGITFNNNLVWNAGNDGSGSGLDADLLDGQHGSYYLSAGSLSGTSNYIPKFSGTNSIDNSVIYQNASGNIGIGTTDPTYKLDVSGDGRFTSNILVNSLTVGRGGGDISTNTALGVDALLSNTTGSNNVAMGFISLRFNTTGASNIAVGSCSLRSNTTGTRNVALGFRTLLYNTTGIDNVATGFQSLLCNTTGNYNVATGQQTLFNNTTGRDNVATGYQTLYSNVSGNYNTAIGRIAGFLTTGDGNTVIGYNTGCTITTGTYNTLLGYNVQTLNATDTNSIVIGYNATGLGSNTISLGDSNITKTVINSGNVGIGTTDPTYKLDVSGDGRFTSDILVNSLTVGRGGGDISTNTALGVDTLYSNTTGCYNVATGINALCSNTTGCYNTATGTNSLCSNITGNNNTATGLNSLRFNTTGYCNIAIGTNSLCSNTTGYSNTATGVNSLRFNTTGSQNVAIGTCSLHSNTTCCNNTAIGYDTLKFNTAPNNTAIGSSSLCSLSGVNAAGNTAIGMASICSNTSGLRNTGVGLGVLLNSTTGCNNVALGAYAGDTLTTGSDNIIIGYNADVAATDSNSIVIGCGATGLGDNSIVIGNSSITKTCINSTRVGIGTDPAATFHVDGSSTSSYGLFTYDGINNAVLGFFAGCTYSALYWKNNTSFRLGASTGITGAGFSERLAFNTSNVVFNELGNNIDFRVEAQSSSTGPLGNKAYAIFVDASAGAVGIGTSQPTYALEVNGTAHVTGTFTAGTKSFLIDHPTKENYLLQYGSLEGPENGVYVRGSSTSSTISLPEYWTGLVEEDSITVTLTPRGKFLPLYIEDIKDYIIYVGGTEIGSLYDYVVYGTRKDVDNLLVEFERPARSS